MVTAASGARAVARCDALGRAPFSDAPDLLFRAYLAPAYTVTLDALAGYMREAGMEVCRDPAGNLVGRYEAREAEAPALLIGSHIDSVRDAGRYDGPLGIMLGIECVAALAGAGRRLRFAIEVVAFGDEEGSRFPSAMLCSRAVAGTLPDGALTIADAEGVTLGAALAEVGLDAARFGEAARPAGSVLGFLEAHIEQGPVLESEGLPLGVVTAIVAQLRYKARFAGTAGHAGTTAMHLRRDALAGAAEAVLAIERIGAAPPEDLVATVGRIAARPGAPNVIAGAAEFTIDVRAADAAVRDAAAAAIRAELATIAARRGLAVVVEQVLDLAATPCDPALSALLAEAVAARGLSPRRLASGAGHDAMALAALCPVAMLFIRCAGGVSHNPAESVTNEDAEEALRAMLGFIDRLEARDAG